MTALAKQLSLILATVVLGTTLFGSAAYAGVPTTDAAMLMAIPIDATPVVTVDGTRPERERGDHHRRFCAKLNGVLTHLVENGVITREQKWRIMEAFNCVPDDRPSTSRPTVVPTTSTR